MSLGVKEDPGSAVADHGDTVLRIKDETEWSEALECAEKEPRCVMQESAGALGSWLLCDRIISLCAPPGGSSCDMLRDHTYASTEYPPADECVKTEPSCSASEWADACADYAVQDELVLGPRCARAECFYPSESSAESVRALAVRAGPAREPRGSRRTLGRCSVGLARLPHRRVPPVRARGSDRDTPARAHGDNIGDEIYTTIDYDKDPICDVCGRRFDLKADLMRHVVVHIYTPAGTEQDEGSADENGDLPGFFWRWARLVPRECRVRLERCDAPRGAATRQERAATRQERAATRQGRAATRQGRAATHPPSAVCGAPPQTRETFLHNWEKYECEICKRKFNTLYCLRRHKSIVHEGTTGLPQVTLVCEICNKRLANLASFHIHERVHTGEKPYFCGVCKQRFTQSGDLKAHKRIHTGENPYRCEICEKKFRRLTDLYRHKYVHTGEKPHCCQTCGMKFNRLYRLTKHIRKHTGEKPFCCEICSKLFSCYDVLKSHKRIHENKAHRKRGRPRKRRTSSRVSERNDTDRKDSNDEKTRDRDMRKKETGCADHKQVGGQVDDETNPHDTKVAMFNP